MSSNKILRTLKNLSLWLANVVVITVASVVAIQGFLAMGISLYPDLVQLVATGNDGTWVLRTWMAFAIFIQLVFGFIMFKYAYNAYTRLKEFKWE